MNALVQVPNVVRVARRAFDHLAWAVALIVVVEAGVVVPWVVMRTMEPRAVEPVK